MKNLRQLCVASILILSLALAAYADDGHMPCPAITPPPPTATATGEIPFPGLQLAESIILSVLSLS